MNAGLKKHFVYWILPSLVIGASMCIYFFNVFGLSFFIAPAFNREFGFIENLQLFLILCIIVVVFRSYKKAKDKFIRLAYLLLTLGSIFIFLEEMDYGLHFYDYLSGETGVKITSGSYEQKPRNIHNQGNLTRYIKQSVYFSFIVLLVLFPILAKRFQFSNKYLNWLIPSQNFIFSLLAMLVLNNLAFYLDNTIKQDSITSLNSNISEFEEIFIYYISLLYLVELERKRIKPSPTL